MNKVHCGMYYKETGMSFARRCYADFQCSNCKSFEEARPKRQLDKLKAKIEAGAYCGRGFGISGEFGFYAHFCGKVHFENGWKPQCYSCQMIDKENVKNLHILEKA